MLRVALQRAPRAAFSRAVHTARPVVGASARFAQWAPAAAVAVTAVGVLGWQASRSDRRVALDSAEPSSSDSPLGSDQPAADLLHAKAEEADESSEVPPGEDPKDAAFDPETGEINWDCPCLGGMAHGPCGQEFRDAFSCFVYSNDEPKGVDCVEKFRAMQTCFREHPDVYGEEIMDDDELDEDPAAAPALASSPAEPEASASAPQTHSSLPTAPHPPPENLPPLPSEYPPAGSPVLSASDTPSKRF